MAFGGIAEGIMSRLGSMKGSDLKRFKSKNKKFTRIDAFWGALGHSMFI